MTKQAMDQNAPLKSAKQFVFGPLIDAPPSHPDTILTMMDYFQKVMKELCTFTVLLSLDMQL